MDFPIENQMSGSILIYVTTFVVNKSLELFNKQIYLWVVQIVTND